MKNTRGLKFLSGVVVVLFLGFIMGGCQKKAIDSDMEGRKGTSDDKKDVTVEELLPYGINALDTEFEVVKANGKELILKSDYATLMLKRF